MKANGLKRSILLLVAIAAFTLAAYSETVGLALVSGLSGEKERIGISGFLKGQIPVVLLFAVGMRALGKRREIER